MFTDGAFIQVPDGVAVAEPVQLIYISSAKQNGETILPRTVRHPAITVDLMELLGFYQQHYAGAMYSGCGGGYLLLATGWADLVVDPIMNPWDIAALVPVIRGAGGVITDGEGGQGWRDSGNLVVGTPGVARELPESLES